MNYGASTLPGSREQETDFRLFLQAELVRRCREIPGYSLRAFAKSLRTDPSSLAKMLRSKRAIGGITIRNFGERMDLSPSEVEDFIASRARRRGTDASAKAKERSPEAPEYQRLSEDTFQIIADWYHYAILEIIRLDTFEKNPRWIAQVLRVPIHEINAALDRLQRTGILEITPSGEWIDRSNGRSTNIAQPYFASAHRRMQKQILEGAVRALQEIPVARRDQSSMTMAIDTNLLGEAKEKIKKFRRELAELLSRSTRRDQVYQLSISLYPVTQIQENQGEEK